MNPALKRLAESITIPQGVKVRKPIATCEACSLAIEGEPRADADAVLRAKVGYRLCWRERCQTLLAKLPLKRRIANYRKNVNDGE